MGRAGAGGAGVAANVTVTDLEKIAGVTPQLDDTDKLAVSMYGGVTSPGDSRVLMQGLGQPAQRMSVENAGVIAFASSPGVNETERPALHVNTQPLRFDPNSLLYFRELTNHNIRILTSAARTATIVSPNQVNRAAKGAIFYLNITVASGTGGLRLRIRTIDPESGTEALLNDNPAAVITTGIFGYSIWPSDIENRGFMTQNTNMLLPPTFGVEVRHLDASSYTYSVAVHLVG